MRAWPLSGNLATASQSGGAPRRFSIYAVIFAVMLAAALFFRRKSPNLLLKRADFPIGILMAADGLLPRIAIDCLRRQEVRARDALSQSPDRRHYGGRLDWHRLFGAGRRAARPRAVRHISGTGLRRPHRAHVRLSGYPGARDGELHDGTPAPSGLKGPSARMCAEQSRSRQSAFLGARNALRRQTACTTDGGGAIIA